MGFKGFSTNIFQFFLSILSGARRLSTFFDFSPQFSLG